MAKAFVACLALCITFTRALNFGDICPQIGLPCTDDYRMICNGTRQCDCRTGSMYSPTTGCIAKLLFQTCDDGSNPQCSQFPGSKCIQGKCDCPDGTFYIIPDRNACVATQSSSTSSIAKCKSDGDCTSLNAKCLQPSAKCSCPPGTMPNYFAGSKCDGVLKMECGKLGVYENCKAIAQASCRLPAGLSYPICTCDSGYIPSGNGCVQLPGKGSSLSDDARIADSCTNSGAPCNPAKTLFCFGSDSPKCGCKAGEVAQMDGTCTADPRWKADTCPAKQVILQGNGVCDGVLGKPCSYAGVIEKCATVDQASCATPDGSAALFCMCAAGLLPSVTLDACVAPGSPTSPMGTSTVNLTHDDVGSDRAATEGAAGATNGTDTKLKDSSASGNKMYIVIGAVAGGLLIFGGIGAFIYLRRRRASYAVSQRPSGTSTGSSG